MLVDAHCGEGIQEVKIGKDRKRSITKGKLRYYKQLDERMQRLFLGMKAKHFG